MGVLVFLLIFVAVGAILVVFSAWLIALSLLHPPRMTDGKASYVLRRISPGDLGLPFETMGFQVRDAQDASRVKRLNLAAWWIPAANRSDRTVVFLHGYADAKVGSIAWAPLWRELGFNVLALDLRAHGESEGRHSTGGYFERQDLEQALDQLRETRPAETRRIVLLGISLGSAVALSVAQSRPDLADAVVLESPFAAFANAATSHAVRLGAPGRIVMPLALRFAAAISGAKFDEIEPLRLLRELQLPILVIQGASDAFVGPRDIAAIGDAARGRPNVTVWTAPDSEHLLALSRQPVEYASMLRTFVSQAIGGGSR